MRVPVATLLVCGGLCGAFGQSAPARPAFEVASVKLVEELRGIHFDVSTSGPRFRCVACSIGELIRYAYDVRNYQVSIPESMVDLRARYDIDAKAEGDSARSKDQFHWLVRTLLAERFKLRFRRENQEKSVYVLVVGRNGPKLKESQPDTDRRFSVGGRGRNYEVTMRHVAVHEIVDAVANAFLDRPVVDQTGLTGIYDASLTYTPNLRQYTQEPELGDISIFTAVQNDLGLRLEAKKAIVEVIVVEHVEKPSQN